MEKGNVEELKGLFENRMNNNSSGKRSDKRQARFIPATVLSKSLGQQDKPIIKKTEKTEDTKPKQTRPRSKTTVEKKLPVKPWEEFIKTEIHFFKEIDNLLSKQLPAIKSQLKTELQGKFNKIFKSYISLREKRYVMPADDVLIDANFKEKVDELNKIFGDEESVFYKTTFKFMGDISVAYDIVIQPFLNKLKETDSVEISNLERVLITPVQRLPRYLLLLKEIEKYTQGYLYEKEKLANMIDALAGKIEQINFLKKCNDNIRGSKKLRYSIILKKEKDAAFPMEWKLIINKVAKQLHASPLLVEANHTLKRIKDASKFFQNIGSLNEVILGPLRLKAIFHAVDLLTGLKLNELAQLTEGLPLPFEKNVRGLLIFTFRQELNFLERPLPYKVNLQNLINYLDGISDGQNNAKQLLELPFDINSFTGEQRCKDNQKEPDEQTRLINVIRLINYGVEELMYKCERFDTVEIKSLQAVADIAIRQLLAMQSAMPHLFSLEEIKAALNKVVIHKNLPSNLLATLYDLVNADTLVKFKVADREFVNKNIVIFNLTTEEQRNQMQQLFLVKTYHFLLSYIIDILNSKLSINATVKQRFVDKFCSYLHSLYLMPLAKREKQINELPTPYSKSIIGLLKFAVVNVVNMDDKLKNRENDLYEGTLAKVLQAIKDFLGQMDIKPVANLQYKATF